MRHNILDTTLANLNLQTKVGNELCAESYYKSIKSL